MIVNFIKVTYHLGHHLVVAEFVMVAVAAVVELITGFVLLIIIIIINYTIKTIQTIIKNSNYKFKAFFFKFNF
jgi:hypothetical protein